MATTLSTLFDNLATRLSVMHGEIDGITTSVAGLSAKMIPDNELPYASTTFLAISDELAFNRPNFMSARLQYQTQIFIGRSIVPMNHTSGVWEVDTLGTTLASKLLAYHHTHAGLATTTHPAFAGVVGTIGIEIQKSDLLTDGQRNSYGGLVVTYSFNFQDYVE